jgi:hypothetical protein
MSATKIKPVQLPTEADLERGVEALRDAVDTLSGISHRVMRAGYFEGTQAPTLEDIGRLYAWVLNARPEVEQLAGYVKSLAGSIDELDYVRLCENRDPDGGTCAGCGRKAARQRMEWDQWRWTDLDTDPKVYCAECVKAGRDAS